MKFVIFFNAGEKTEERDLIIWAEAWGIHGDIPKKYCLHQLIYSDNAFSRSAAKGCLMENTSLWYLAKKDIEELQKQGFHRQKTFWEQYVPANQNSLWQRKEERLFEHFLHDDAESFLKALCFYYKTYGFGDFAFYPFFRWDEGLQPIHRPDLVAMDSLLGYEDQKQQIIENTEAFLNGARGNHVLLYGQRGTGKSSTVKALGKLYFPRGLRLVELDRQKLKELPQLYQSLEEIALHFIIYIDDLSFEDTETDYKSLKAVLEGSLTAVSEHILLYATSNRRHLVRETWQQRQDDDVHVGETQDEILSLSHRFGLSVPFFSPEREEFLQMVETMAAQRHIKMAKEELRREAILWTRWQQGLSGRTAVQFINAMEVREKERQEER